MGIFLAIIWVVSTLVLLGCALMAYFSYDQHEAPPPKSVRIAGTLAVAGFMAGLTYYVMPVMAADFHGVWLLTILGLGLLGVIWAPFATTIAVPSVLVLYWLVSFVASSEMMHSDRYYALLGKEKAAEFSASLPPIDIEQAPLVSYEMAVRSMEKRLAEVPALGSQVYVGRPTKQIVKGQLQWVAFLHHHSIIKWYLNETTPGYVTVSATNPSNVHLVQAVKGKPLKLRYLTSASFGDNIERFAYRSGLNNVGLTDFSPEIDDEGRPYYVVSLYAHTIGLSGSEVTGVATIDAETGAIKRYSLANIPKWIDRVHPEDFMEDQLSDRGNYVHGYWNPSDKDRLRVSGSLDLVYSHEGHAYWFAGMTSTSSDAGLVGFTLIDSRTKEVRHFKIAAVAEHVAQSVVENVNPEKGYHSTTPLPFMVQGIPTYVMGLTDSQGVARAFGMVSMQNHQILAVADTLTATLRVYEAQLSTNKTQADIGSSRKMASITARILRIASEMRNNQTTYYVMLESPDDVSMAERIFTATSDISEELVLTQPGDKVTVEVSETRARIQAMAKFDNLMVGKP